MRMQARAWSRVPIKSIRLGYGGGYSRDSISWENFGTSSGRNPGLGDIWGDIGGVFTRIGAWIGKQIENLKHTPFLKSNLGTAIVFVFNPYIAMHSTKWGQQRLGIYKKPFFKTNYFYYVAASALAGAAYAAFLAPAYAGSTAFMSGGGLKLTAILKAVGSAALSGISAVAKKIGGGLRAVAPDNIPSLKDATQAAIDAAKAEAEAEIKRRLEEEARKRMGLPPTPGPVIPTPIDPYVPPPIYTDPVIPTIPTLPDLPPDTPPGYPPVGYVPPPGYTPPPGYLPGDPLPPSYDPSTPPSVVTPPAFQMAGSDILGMVLLAGVAISAMRKKK